MTVVALLASVSMTSVLPVNALAAPAPRSAGPPRALMVGSRTAPLGIDDPTPDFAWQLDDARKGAVQSAYRILVARTATTDPLSQSVLWDSGRVASSQQAFVLYGGPGLAPDTAYSWTVQTWDGEGSASPFARRARFETGLGDRDWKAAWIRRIPAPNELDQYTYARKELTLGASPITRARAYASASHQYELSINGRRADKGQSFAYPDSQYYQTTDVTRLLRPGAVNAIGALVHYYGGGKGRPAAAPGLIVQISVSHRDGSTEMITTDGTWRVQRGPWEPAPLRNEEGDFVERIDGRAIPTGWDRPGFEDHAWPLATVIGAHPTAPWTHLRSQSTRIVERRVAPVSLTELDSGAYVADFGAVIAAVPVVTFERGSRGRRINMRAGYVLDPDGQVSRTKATQATDMSYQYVETGRAQTFRPFGFLGFRYLQIDDPHEAIPRGAVAAYARHVGVPDEHAATFSSSDTVLNSVWELARHSALYGSQEQFLDTPTREKGQFVGDSFNISSTAMRAFGERNLTQQALRDFAQSQARFWPDGPINAIYPTAQGKRDIPDYTELYPEWVWRYYEDTGDRRLLQELYPVMTAIADYVARYVDPNTGLVTALAGGGNEDYKFGLVDWPPAMRYGYDVGTSARTTVNVLAVNVFRRVGQAATDLARPAAEVDAQHGRELALTRAINARLTRPDGTYVDGLEADATPSPHASQHANADALAYGIVPPDRAAAVAGYVASLGIAMGPMTAEALLRALHTTGRDADLVRLVTDRRHPGWAAVLAHGGTYTWESWTPSDAEGDSESHAWGATVLVEMQEALLGVTPLEPGFARVEIRPPARGLSKAKGRVPTEHGDITVAWERKTRSAGPLTLRVTIPPNSTATVRMPNPNGGETAVDIGSGSYNFRAGS